MKPSTLLPFSILVAVASALVIPNVQSQDIFAIITNNDKVAITKETPKDLDSTIFNNELLAPENAVELISTESAGRNIIPHRYIIVFKEGISLEEVDFHKQWVETEHIQHVQTLRKRDPSHQFFQEVEAESITESLGGILDHFHIDGLLSGYYGYFLDSTIDLIRRNPLVKFVEKDSRVFASEFDTQNGAPWGLSRISHREPLTLGSFNKYLYDNEAGEGVTSYVIDTGVNVNHRDFQGRAHWGKTIPQGDADVDGNGHGTHCAGTIGSKHYGVAKKAKIVAVKVLRSNGSGSMSDVVKGVEFAANEHIKAAKEKAKGFKGSTANMSLGGGKSPALDMAVNAAVEAGIHFAVAAGNDNADACNYSPAAAEKAVTVGASTLSDSRAYFSNYGKCVDIFGPGLNILSTYIGSDSATATLSGTSMASPHVCGLLTYYLSLQPSADSEFFTEGCTTPSQLKNKIIDYATKDVLNDIPSDTPNHLIYNGGGKDLSDFWQAAKEAEHSTANLEEHLINLEQKAETYLDEIKHLIGGGIF